MQIILASSSPRRRELLSGAGYSFSVEVPHVDEMRLHQEHAIDFVQRVAYEKAMAVLQTLPPVSWTGKQCIIAGDTAVVLDENILGKPTDKAAARTMLSALSGKTHQVISGVCLLMLAKGQLTEKKVFAVQTDVTFKSLSQDEIERYIDTGDPFDKAGAYGIQSGAAYMIREIHGSYTNVVGLPLTEVVEILREFETV